MKTYYEQVDKAIDALRQLPLGTRVVVRYRIDGAGQTEVPGAPAGSAACNHQPRLTDVIGILAAVDPTTCTVRTKAGDVVVVLASVQAAKPVPPAPQRRARPFSAR